jgi:acetyl-CoA carboxylase biotin carboxyl carrier protein
LFGEAAEPLLHTIRGRGRREETDAAALEPTRAERIREIVRIVQESGVNEVTIEDAGMRVTVRRGDERTSGMAAPEAEEGLSGQPEPTAAPAPANVMRIEAPMVGTFYRAPEPGAPPFVNEGDIVVAGQTLCILEAMKLMNKVEAEIEAIVRRIHVGDGEPVEYGQLLFELEPVDGRPPAF